MVPKRSLEAILRQLSQEETGERNTGLLVYSDDDFHITPLIFSREISKAVVFDGLGREFRLDIPGIDVRSCKSKRNMDSFLCGVDAIMLLKFALLLISHEQMTVDDLFEDDEFPSVLSVVTQKNLQI